MSPRAAELSEPILRRNRMSLIDTKQFERRLFNGQWVEAAARVPVREPATGEILFEAGLASKGEIAEAAKTARATQRAWAAKPHEERSAIFRKAADLFDQHAEAITPLLMRETGSIQPKRGGGGFFFGGGGGSAAGPRAPAT